MCSGDVCLPNEHLRAYGVVAQTFRLRYAARTERKFHGRAQAGADRRVAQVVADPVVVPRRRRERRALPVVRSGPVHRAAPRRLPADAQGEGGKRGPLRPRPRRRGQAEEGIGHPLLLDLLRALRDGGRELPRVLRGPRARPRRRARPLHRVALPRRRIARERSAGLRRADRGRLHAGEAGGRIRPRADGGDGHGPGAVRVDGEADAPRRSRSSSPRRSISSTSLP